MFERLGGTFQNDGAEAIQNLANEMGMQNMLRIAELLINGQPMGFTNAEKTVFFEAIKNYAINNALEINKKIQYSNPNDEIKDSFKNSL